MYHTVYEANFLTQTSSLLHFGISLKLPNLLPLDFPDLIKFNYEIKKLISFL